MEKKLVEKQLFSKDFDGECAKVKISDIPKEFLDDNDCIVEIGREQAFFSENNSYDAYTRLIVSKMVPETDEEFNERVRCAEIFKEQSKARRLENFKKLKEEFEPEK